MLNFTNFSDPLLQSLRLSFSVLGLQNMPRHFAREHLPKINRKITLWDPQGNPWEISFVCYNTHCSLSGGWGAFSFANNLEKYDVCVFELVRKNNLKVHIFRVVESIAPLIRRSQLRD